MAIDYEAAAIRAQAKIQQYGRSILLTTRGKTPADPAKPWRGGSGPDIEHLTHGLFVPPNQVRIFGLSALGEGTEFNDFFANSEQIIICMVPTEINLKQFNFVEDSDDTEWAITGTQELKPGNVRVLSFVGTRR